MARAFASASTQYLSYSGSISISNPLTIAAWGYPLQNNVGCVLVSLENGGSADGRYFIAFGSGGTVTANKEDNTGTGAGAIGPSYSANAWNHVCGVFTSSASRTCYRNGVAGTPDLTSIADPTITSVSVGTYKPSGGATLLMNGNLAHAAIWNAALSATEVASLYNNGIGADPRSVRPDALVAYWPLLSNDGDQDYWGNYHLTASGSPTYAQHPPVLMRSRPKYVVLGAASGAPTISSVTITGTRTVSNTLTANVVTNPVTVDSIAYQWEIADDGSGTNAADLSGETSQTLALTYADFASRLDANGEAYVRVGAIATVGAEASAESFSDWVRVTAGGSGVVRPIGQSVYISV